MSTLISTLQEVNSVVTLHRNTAEETTYTVPAYISTVSEEDAMADIERHAKILREVKARTKRRDFGNGALCVAHKATATGLQLLEACKAALKGGGTVEVKHRKRKDKTPSAIKERQSATPEVSTNGAGL